MNKLPIILDVDLGVDDACALLLALSCSNLELLGVTTTFGNRQLERTNRNTLAFLDYIGRKDIPVAKGADRPLVRSLPVYEDEGPYVVHGAEGLGNAIIPEYSKKNDPLAAEDFIASLVEKSSETVTLVPVGPMTNIAKFLCKYPHLHHKIKQISFMGGGLEKGNITQHAEVNIYFDAEAANIVLNSDVPIIMCPLEATHQAYITKDEREKIKDIKNQKLSRLLFPALDYYGKFYETVGNEPGCVLHDSLAVMAIAYPEYIEFEDMRISIVTVGEEYGRTMEDANGKVCRVATKVNREEFIRLFFESLV